MIKQPFMANYFVKRGVINYNMRRLKDKIRQMAPQHTIKTELTSRLLSGNKNKIVLMDVPTNGNLGDQAIVYATKKFIKSVAPQFEIVEIPNDWINSSLNVLKKLQNKYSLVLWNGGGNIGDLYPTAEYSRWDAFSFLQKESFIIFPQSVFFSDKTRNKKFLNRSVKEYKNKKNLTIFLREEKSFQYMESVFRLDNLFLVPDIVFSLENQFPIHKELANREEKVLTLLRSDKERGDLDIEKYLNYMMENGLNITRSDTYFDFGRVTEDNRDQILQNFWNQISRYKLIVTDRLHGMIFAYLTRTPALVFQNNNWKIKSTYDTWLKGISWITIVSPSMSETEVQRAIEDVTAKEPNYTDVAMNFDSLKKVLREMIGYGQK